MTTGKHLLIAFACCLFLSTAPIPAHTQNSATAGSMGFDWPTWQKDSSAQFVAIQHSVTNWFNRAALINISEKPITTIQIGCVVRSDEDSQPKHTLFTMESSPLAVAIEPKKAAIVTTPLWNTGEFAKRVYDLGIRRARATFGITRIVYADGQEYRYDLASEKEFRSEKNAEAARVHNAIDRSFWNEFDK